MINYIVNCFSRSAGAQSKAQTRGHSVTVIGGLMLVALITFAFVGCDEAIAQIFIPAPTSLSAVGGDEQVTLSWNTVDSATEYRIYRNGVNAPVASVTAPAVTYTDSGLTNGTSYTYIVRTVNFFGESSDSDVASATPRTPGIVVIDIDPPAGLTATAGDERIILTWNAVDGAAEYRIYRNSVTTPVAAVTSSTTTYTDRDLANGTPYTYTVRAVSPDGETESGDSVSADATPTPPVADAPTGLRATAGDDHVILNWNGVANATSYNIYRDGADAPTYNIIAPITNHTDTGRSSGATHTYIVRAVNGGGVSGESNMESVTLRPAAPTGFSAASRNTRIILTWSSAAGADEYRIFRDGAALPIVTVAAPATSHADTRLTNGDTYNYTIRAVNSGGVSDSSTTASDAPGNIDSDNDLLIDIFFLEELDNIRHNLDGTAYRASATDSGIQCGASGTTECIGYELMRDLDFNDADSYINGVFTNDWRPNTGDHATATNDGWVPIAGVTGGPRPTSFSAILEGNGNTITDLYVRTGQGNPLIDFVGLFGVVENGTVRNIGLINGAAYSISHCTIGILTGSVSSNSTIVASYASGGVIRGDDYNETIGGLVGGNSGTILASYATVDVSGGGGADSIGGLVGNNTFGTVTASYSTVDVDGGGGDDRAGGLVGNQTGYLTVITASYATGNVNDGLNNDSVGALVGSSGTLSGTPTITASYGFGTVEGETVGVISTPPSGVTSINALTLANAGTQWNDAGSGTAGAWDFRTTSQRPVLQYADYDGAGGGYVCANAASLPARAVPIFGCGTGPLPGQ